MVLSPTELAEKNLLWQMSTEHQGWGEGLIPLEISFLVKVEEKEYFPTLWVLSSLALEISPLPLSSSKGQPPGPGGVLELSLAKGCFMPKDNWFLGETWFSAVVRNAPSPALAAFQILAIRGTLPTKWKAPAPQSKPKCKPNRQKAFSCPPQNLKLDWRILKVIEVS